MTGEDVSVQDERFLRALRELNERVDVDPDTIDLLEAFARVRIASDREVAFRSTAKVPNHQAFRALLQKNQALDRTAIGFLSAYFLETRRNGIVCVLSNRHLAALLDTPLSELVALAETAESRYGRFKIKKRSGGEREILTPSRRLKIVQRTVLDTILHHVPLNDRAEGFRKQRSTRTNASRHVGKRVVVKLDLVDFFPSISAARVHGVFTHMGYPAGVARLLTRLTTCAGRLPIGAPTSPALANIVCRRLDKRLAGLGERMEFAYSRYADDLTFSSDRDNFPGLIPLLKEIIVDEGFVVNSKKVRIARQGRRQEVTGIVVNNGLGIAREQRRKLRAVLNNCRRYGIHAEARKWALREKQAPVPAEYTVKQFRNSLLATINYVRTVNARQGEELLRQFEYLS